MKVNVQGALISSRISLNPPHFVHLEVPSTHLSPDGNMERIVDMFIKYGKGEEIELQ